MKMAGSRWMRIAPNRPSWKPLGKASSGRLLADDDDESLSLTFKCGHRSATPTCSRHIDLLVFKSRILNATMSYK